MSGVLEVGLLGPLDIRVAGQTMSFPSPKHRILLAALLVEPGRAVPVAKLVEAVWGLEPPAKPRRALQLYVARVRTTLAEAGASEVIHTELDGYRAEADPSTVDVVRFQEWLAEAEGAARRSDPVGERVALTAATGLWRGEAFADVPSDGLHREFGRRLGEQRLRALERRIDLSLGEGRYGEVVDELVRLTALHPLREKLWAQLMTALHRGGRRADALHTYHLLRRQLAEDLGIEPGVELRELHATILGTGGGSGSPVVPRQLPSDLAGFAGRAAEIERMHAVLDEHEARSAGSTILVLTGMAGVGKTTLASHWARRIADRFPDGQLWLDLRGYHRRAAVPPEHALGYLLRAFDVRGADVPADLDARAGLYRSLMDGRRALIVLDNAGSADQVRPLLPGGTGSFVLVTSRAQLTGLVATEGARVLSLEPFTTAEARQMLGPRLGHERIGAEPRAVDRIIGRCGGLPLALAIVATRLVARPRVPLAALDKQLADARDRLDGFAIPDAGIDVRAAFSWSYHALAPSAARLFRLLGLHPTTDLSTPAVASLAGTGSATSATRDLLDQLAAAHLVTERATDRFAMHELVHAYAAELAAGCEPADSRRAAQRRLVAWLASTAFNARPWLQPSESPVRPPSTMELTEGSKVDDYPPLTFDAEREAREWYDAERHNLVAGVRLAYEHRFDDVCWRLAYATWVHLHACAAWADVLSTHQLGLRAAERSGDRAGQAHMLTGIGSAYRASGQRTAAIDAHRRALATFQGIADLAGVAAALSNLSVAYRDAGRFTEALDNARQAYELERAAGEPGNMAISLYHIGLTLTAADRPAEAVPVITDSLWLWRRIGHRHGEARARYALATAHTRVGEHAAAMDHYRAAVALNQEAGDRRYQAAALAGLGDALYRAGHHREGRDARRQAAAILDELRVPGRAVSS